MARAKKKKNLLALGRAAVRQRLLFCSVQVEILMRLMAFIRMERIPGRSHRCRTVKRRNAGFDAQASGAGRIPAVAFEMSSYKLFIQSLETKQEGKIFHKPKKRLGFLNTIFRNVRIF